MRTVQLPQDRPYDDEPDTDAVTIGREGRGWALVMRVVLIAGPAILLLLGAWSYRWMSDDGFINLRVVREIQAGHGPVFNSGQRVEVATSTLWVWLLAAADEVLPFRLEWIAVVMGIAMSIFGLVAGMAASLPARVLERRVPLGALVFVSIPAVWEFSSSGLEGGLSVGWIGLCALLIVRACQPDSSRTQQWIACAVVGLGPLVRPDLALVSVAGLLCLLLWTPRTKREVAIKLLFVAILPVGYQVFRMGFYGALVPNTALAKEAGDARWGQGWYYLVDFATTYWLWVPIAVLVACLASNQRRPPVIRQERVLLVLAAGGIADALYVVRLGGDFMHGRMLIPALFALLLPVLTVGTKRLLDLVLASAIIVWAVTCTAFLRPHSNAHDVTDERVTYQRITGRDHPIRADQFIAHRFTDTRSLLFFGGKPMRVGGRTVATRAGTGPVVLVVSAGAESYSTPVDVYVLDLRGLGDWFTARTVRVQRGKPGHEKTLTLPWVYARFAAPGAPFDETIDTLLLALNAKQTPSSARERILGAQHILACSSVEELRSAATKPLTVSRFFDNVAVSVSLRNLRIPPDPSIDRCPSR